MEPNLLLISSCLILADIQDPLVKKPGAGDPTVDLTGEKEDSSIAAGSVPEVAQGEAEATPTQQQEVRTDATPTQHQQESREQEQTDAACNNLPSQEETEKVALDIGRGPRGGEGTGGGILERKREREYFCQGCGEQPARCHVLVHVYYITHVHLSILMSLVLRDVLRVMGPEWNPGTGWVLGLEWDPGTGWIPGVEWDPGTGWVPGLEWDPGAGWVPGPEWDPGAEWDLGIGYRLSKLLRCIFCI